MIFLFVILCGLQAMGQNKRNGFFGKEEAIKVIEECEERYKDIYLKKFD